MKYDWKVLGTIIVALITTSGLVIPKAASYVTETAELKAKEELRKEYDKKYEGVTTQLITVSTDYAVLKETCCK